MRPTAEFRNLDEELEQRVLTRTEELLRTNRELELFAWNVSHDLRTPLRAVSIYLDLFREENDPKLDGRAHDLLNRVKGGCSRIAALLEGLHQLSRLAHTGIRREAVNLSSMAALVVSDLHGLESRRKVDVQVEAGLIEQADRALVTILLENLIGNAWKFTGKTESPKIWVGRTPPENGGWFYVRDNGVGFNAAAASGLFTPFERFHSREDFEGSGIGLATVERIILRHGGKIRAESEPGKGAAVYFTLGPDPGP